MEKKWLTEPDRKEWKSDTGLTCLIVRNPMGALCGYVGVAPDHPWHGKDYNDVDADVHGGLTYANKCEGHVCHTPAPGEEEHLWWLGFDCAHAGDFVPSMDVKLAPMYQLSDSFLGINTSIGKGNAYRDIEYVTAECESLASQALAAIGN